MFLYLIYRIPLSHPLPKNLAQIFNCRDNLILLFIA